mmetsp:Transcript_115073/g.325975  ORF Transcript_115073/g.325975 Transcript_115073/m.325975 type:complete len:109 (+) Transcript_115073:899-1225(+)
MNKAIAAQTQAEETALIFTKALQEIAMPQAQCLKLGSRPYDCKTPEMVSKFQCAHLDGVYKPGCDANGKKFPAHCFVKTDETDQKWEGACVAISTEDFDKAKAKVQAA